MGIRPASRKLRWICSRRDCLLAGGAGAAVEESHLRGQWRHDRQIPINRDGSSGDQSVLYQSPDAITLVDGIAADKEGNVYATVLGTTNDFVNWESGVLRIDGKAGEATWIYDESGGADAPLSVAFGRGPHDKTTLYVANTDDPLFGNPDVAGATIVKIDVGVKGTKYQPCGPKVTITCG